MQIAEHKTPAQVTDVGFSDGFLYATSMQAGLLLFDLDRRPNGKVAIGE